MCIVRNENWVALFKKHIIHTDASEMLLAAVDSLSTVPSQKMRDSVPSARYSSVCNVLRQWRIWLIPTL